MQYNKEFRKARVIVEHVIGRLKARWPVLLTGLRFMDMEKCSRAIEVFVALYNYILQEEGDYDDYDTDETPTDHLAYDPKAKYATCNKILEKYYNQN